MNKLKKTFILLVSTFVCLTSCRDQLDVVNPNQPTEEDVQTEAGIMSLAQSVYITDINDDDTGSNISLAWYVLANHEIAGDALFIPWGNFSWRWVNQPTWIRLDDGTQVNPPQGGSQGTELINRNTRAFGDDNAFLHEWAAMYRINNTANLILSYLDAGNIEFTGDAAAKENTLRAWAHWWKGYAYSRIGSMYVAGLILDEPNTTNNTFVDRTVLIQEATEHFDRAVELLQPLGAAGAFTDVMRRVVPSFLTNGAGPGGLPTPEMLIRNINTMKARNILVNIKRAEMTAEQWNQILTLTNAGLQANDFEFILRQDDIFISTGWVPARFALGWNFVSERLVQDFRPGDDRFTRNFVLLPEEDWEVNISGRGLQYGTRWDLIPIEDGGDYASELPGQARAWIAGSYEENELMKAEANIFLGNIPAALQSIDRVREAQNAGLPGLSGSGLDVAQALEELRSERRVGLFLRGLAFYDARRWGVIDPVEQGGGRQGVVVLDASGSVNTNATINYNYLPYWSVPDNELTFNEPAPGSARVRAAVQ